MTPMIQNTQIVYAKPPADGALPDPAGTFNVVHTTFDTEAMNLKAGEVLVENQYLSIDPYHRFGLYDPAVTHSQFPVFRQHNQRDRVRRYLEGLLLPTDRNKTLTALANPEPFVGARPLHAQRI